MREVKCDFVGGRSRGKYFFVVVFKYRENMTITRRNRWKRTSMSITVSLSLSPFFKDRRTSEENVLNFYVLHLRSFVCPLRMFSYAPFIRAFLSLCVCMNVRERERHRQTDTGGG